MISYREHIFIFQVEALHLDQANTDFFILCELLKDYLGLLGAVRDAFHERTKLFQHWQHSQQMLAKKREAKAKLELTNRLDKLDQANAEVIEVDSHYNLFNADQTLWVFAVGVEGGTRSGEFR